MNKESLTARGSSDYGRMRALLISALAVATLAFARPAPAAVRLPAVLGDHMVLQQKTEAPVWGWANPGERVRVEASWETAGRSTTADAHGHWRAALRTPAAGGPFTITISAENTITLSDVLVGEVWLCSGQSNMQMALNFPKPGYGKPVLNHREEIRLADHPRLRLFHIPYKSSDTPLEDCKAGWQACSPETVGDFSAIGYFFGRELLQRLGVPIGVINASQGGSALESWVSPAVLAADPEFAHILARYENALKNLPATMPKYQRDLEAWKQLPPEAQARSLRPIAPFGQTKFCAPSTLYNGMINPVLPFSIRGVIFYQGEENAIWPTNYRKLFAAMIHSWREAWERRDLAFLYCQLLPCGPPGEETNPIIDQYVAWHDGGEQSAWKRAENWARVQEAQLQTLRLPNTGMAVTVDIGDPEEGHAPNKQEVARRLARWALAGPYGQDVVCAGPLYRSMRRNGDQITISFEPLQSPLRSDATGPLKGFVVAGEDRIFHPADARIEGDEVVVTSRAVRDPVAVRYGWAQAGDFGLFNQAGLPASPFRTDDW